MWAFAGGQLMMTMLSLMQLRSITNPGVLAFLFFAPCSLFFCQQITYYLASVFFCSGALHFIASNNDCGVRDFDMERYQLVNHFHFPWPVNVSSFLFLDSWLFLWHKLMCHTCGNKLYVMSCTHESFFNVSTHHWVLMANYWRLWETTQRAFS